MKILHLTPSGDFYHLGLLFVYSLGDMPNICN
nr:MAG TPA: Protein of unknown function (DUF2877) [Caudoviricetes sp.]